MNNCDCKNNMSQETLLQEIMNLNFAINELVLYLDTHPSDSCAIRMHSEYSKKVMELIEEYQKLYGPLTVNFTSNDSNCWKWSEEPWPWERGAY